jgi:hypothetical protein
MITSFTRQHPRLTILFGLLAIVLVAALVLVIFFVSRSYAMTPQPLPFEHNKHVEAGINCLYCHPGATNGAVAGLPSMAKCMGCHVSVEPKNPADQAAIDKVIKQWESKQPVEWVKVFDQPDFVHFNHRPHLAAGVACESCHGDVSKMGYAQPYNLNMGFCLDCHRKQSPEKVKRLIDCSTCHY